MANPLEALRKAQSIGSGPSPRQKVAQSIFEGGIDALTGLVGAGPDTTAGSIGGILGAVSPIVTSRPAIAQLIRLLRTKPTPVSPLAYLGRVTSRGEAPPGPIEAPEGFALPKDFTTKPLLSGRTPTLRQPDVPIQAVKSLEDLAYVSPVSPIRPIPQSVAAMKTGPMAAGGFRKLDVDTVRSIRALKAEGYKPAEIVKKFPAIKPDTLKAAYQGDTWGWVK